MNYMNLLRLLFAPIHMSMCFALFSAPFPLALSTAPMPSGFFQATLRLRRFHISFVLCHSGICDPLTTLSSPIYRRFCLYITASRPLQKCRATSSLTYFLLPHSSFLKLTVGNKSASPFPHVLLSPPLRHFKPFRYPVVLLLADQHVDRFSAHELLTYPF